MNTSYYNGVFPNKITLKRCFSLFVTLLILVIITTTAQGQQVITVTGQVMDENNDPLPGATVVVEGTEIGTATDIDGTYEIDAAENAVLIFSFVGYETQRISIQGRERIDVSLNVSYRLLDEILVIGYGEQSRRTVTTSISRISADDMPASGTTSLSSALQGKASGVRVFHGDGGMPGSDATIRIRGGSSINRSNAPLVLVDGLERPLTDINPNDVETISVLKDASSTAVYGARASNGVILVTTKRGREGVSNINFEASSGVASPWRYMDLIGGEDYLRLTREALARSPRSAFLWQRGRGAGVGNDASSPWSTRYLVDGESIPSGYKSMTDPVDPSKTIIFQDNDYQRLALRDAREQSYYLSGSGGTESILYAAGIGYTDLEGIAIGTNWNRFSARVNVDFRLNNNLTLLTNFDHTLSSTNTWPSQHSMFNRSLFMTPTARVYMDDGSFAPGLNATYTNPLWYNDVHNSDEKTYRTQFGASLLWSISEKLNFRSNADYFIRTTDREQFQKANVYSSARPATFNYIKNNRVQFEGIFNYQDTFLENHNVRLMLGSSFLTFSDLDARASAFGASTDKIQTLNAAPEKSDAHTFSGDEALFGTFARLTYDFSEKYLFGLSLRRDESSRFAPDNRVGYFPGASIGWIVTEESFIDLPAINVLKLRSSWGKTGNNNVGRFAAWGQYSVGANYAFEAGVFPTVMPNLSLGWESTTQVDFGFDLTMLNYRLNILVDYYTKETDQLIFNTPLPNTSGFNNILRNIGTVKYYGWDFEITYQAIERTKLSWDVGLNVSLNKNEVLRLPDNGRPQNRIGGVYNPNTGIGVGGIAEGEPLGQIIGFRADFIIDNWEQANNAHFDTQANGYNPEDGTRQRGRKIPGDMEWVDKDGNGIIDIHDQFVLGYQMPHTVGGISNYFSYRNFDLKVFMDYAIGHSISDKVIRRADANALDGISRPTTNVFRAWQQEGDVASGHALMPRYDYHDPSQQRNIHRGDFNTSTTTYRADYLSIREITLGYTFPATLTNRIGFSNLNVYVTGQNLHYFTKYPGFVPEFQGIDNYRDGNFPMQRKFHLGIKIGF